MSILRLISIILLAAALFSGTGRSPVYGSGSPVLITDFNPASGNYKCGDTAVSSVTFKNSSHEKKSFWVGYSVCDASMVWHDAPYTGPVILEPGAVSTPVSLSWKVPDDDSFPDGKFRVRMALWNAPPDFLSSLRYAFIDRENSFCVSNTHLEKVFTLGGIDFKPAPDTSKPTRNRGKLLFRNVSYSDGKAEIAFQPQTFDGGQIESTSTFTYGTFSIELKTCRAKKSVTGFFLYDPSSEDEITMEIFNDDSRRLWLTSYISSGDPLEKIEIKLPFDPSEAYHSYAISYSEEKIVFYAEGSIAGTIENSGNTKKVPAGSKMKILINSWFPGWNDFKPFSDEDRPPERCFTHIKDPLYKPVLK